MRTMTALVVVCAAACTGGFDCRRTLRWELADYADVPCERRYRGLHVEVCQRDPEWQLSRRARDGGRARLPAGRRQDRGGWQRQAVCQRHCCIAGNMRAGVFAHKGESYSYDVKASFTETARLGHARSGSRHRGAAVHVRLCEADSDPCCCSVRRDAGTFSRRRCLSRSTHSLADAHRSESEFGGALCSKEVWLSRAGWSFRVLSGGRRWVRLHSNWR